MKWSGARRALAAVELADRADEIASALSHGEQRQLELAMCLATEPQLLLLDEPLAGMGAEESLKMVELIGRLADTHAILLVEHDMDAVFQLAERSNRDGKRQSPGYRRAGGNSRQSRSAERVPWQFG